MAIQTLGVFIKDDLIVHEAGITSSSVFQHYILGLEKIQAA